ncbi:winged helix-turn-helix transcriptional regulator [Nocardiopsis sediminis]|uniref:Winged helix-turn-helix transcriptional regulator n=1 Tax=Nocardiopsis sediminis TaxID=1778267 RepID=A0ABV8FH43_9ACTN
MTSSPEAAPAGSAGLFDDVAFDVFARRCASRSALENITGRWGVLVLAALHDDTYRFNALRRRVDGVSEKMLAQTLHTLERDGFVVRTVQRQIPPRVEYSLTPLGRDTSAKLLELIGFLEHRMDEVVAARDGYDSARD